MLVYFLQPNAFHQQIVLVAMLLALFQAVSGTVFLVPVPHELS